MDYMSVSPSHRTFRETAKVAERQIHIETIPKKYQDQARELAAIMAEVYMMRPGGQTVISGERLDTALVQQVFAELDTDHVIFVIENFNKIAHRIQNKKFYLRTALYNSIFEYEADLSNRVKCDLGIRL